MKRSVVALAGLFAVLISVGFAQTGKSIYYDTFNGPWISPAKWLAGGPGCDQGNTLECVREIQNGHLRMEVRNVGATDSDAGLQFTGSELHFVNPEAINSIAADVTVQRFNGVACPANNTDMTRAVIGIRGVFFNTGSGDPNDDIRDSVYFMVDTNHPKTVRVLNFVDTLGLEADIGQYPIGTALTVLNIWDKVNHRFISVVRVVGDDGPGKTVIVPYGNVSDTTPPASADGKFLHAWSYSLNCAAVQTFSQVEAFFDNVMINAVPPNQNQQ